MPALIVAPKFVWQKITMALPSDSPYFAHARCAGCIRPNGSQLSAATVKHICLILADAVSVNDPESRAYRGIPAIARAGSRDRRTVMAALGHLQTVGLIDRIRLGGGLNVTKGLPSAYSLTLPDAALLKLAGVDVELLQRAKEQLHQAPAPGWFGGDRAHVS